MVAIIGAAIAAIGIGAQVLGASEASDAAKKEAKAEAKGAKKQAKLTKKQNKVYSEMAEAQSKAAKKMADAKTATATENNAIRDETVGNINTARQKMVEAQNQQSDASVEAETQRHTQMTLDAQRQRREVYRNAIIARSNALAGATASGASGGSGLAGGMAQIAAQKLNLLTGIFQNTDIGNAIFQANKMFTEAGALVNQYQAEQDTAQSLGEAKLANNSALGEAQLSRIQARFQDEQATLQKDAYKIDDKKAKAASKTNAQVGNAKSDMVTAQGIQQIGSSLTSAGTSLI